MYHNLIIPFCRCGTSVHSIGFWTVTGVIWVSVGAFLQALVVGSGDEGSGSGSGVCTSSGLPNKAP